MNRRHNRASEWIVVTAACVLVVATAGCGMHVQRRALLTPDEFLTSRRTLPWSPAAQGGREAPAVGGRRAPAAHYLKAHLEDGAAIIFSQWDVDPSGLRIAGQGSIYDVNRVQTHAGTCSVPLDSVVLFETNVIQTAPIVAELAVLSGLSAGVSIYCLSNPKACFGSCPTFYAWDGQRALLQAEGFSASVSPALEARDIDALYRARPQGRRFSITMKNEALETHVVRCADVLAAERPQGGRIFVTGTGEFRATTDLIAPLRCGAEEGDCREVLLAFDGRERCSPADSTDLAAREEIELEFAVPAGASGEDWGLVIASRQTLLTTYLFYQALAYMGRSAGTWLAALERGDAATRARSGAIGEVLGGIEVLAPDDRGGWTAVGSTRETGPLAADVRLVPLPAGSGAPAKLRLRLARGAWRLDWVALAKLGSAVEPMRLSPVRVLRHGEDSAGALAALRDRERPLTTLPGDEYELVYDLPGDFESRELFLESRGYYLEWMRDAWLAEENPAMAAVMVTDPHLALRLLAPAFKRVEPRMETLFWESRYVRE